jgi:hypothetical protein
MLYNVPMVARQMLEFATRKRVALDTHIKKEDTNSSRSRRSGGRGHSIVQCTVGVLGVGGWGGGGGDGSGEKGEE